MFAEQKYREIREIPDDIASFLLRELLKIYHWHMYMWWFKGQLIANFIIHELAVLAPFHEYLRRKHFVLYGGMNYRGIDRSIWNFA